MAEQGEQRYVMWFEPAGTTSFPSTFAVLIVKGFALMLLGSPGKPPRVGCYESFGMPPPALRVRSWGDAKCPGFLGTIFLVYSFRTTPGGEGAWLFWLGTGPTLLCYGSHGLVGWGELCPVTHVGRAPTASVSHVGWQGFVVELMESASAGLHSVITCLF